MAEVTHVATSTRHVLGDLVFRSYTISGPSGSTFTFPQTNVLYLDNQSATAAGAASLITTWSAPIGVGGASQQSQITLTSSGPMVQEVFEIFSRVG